MKSRGKDLTGLKLKNLEVIGPAPHPRYWVCRCSCGVEREVRSDHLRKEETTGCRRCSCHLFTHGLSGTPEHTLWMTAKLRARKRNLPFTIEITDIHIPKYCPLLGLRLTLEDGHTGRSPSLDQIEPGLGYTKKNTHVISTRANTIKSDLTVNQLKIFVKKLVQIKIEKASDTQINT